MKITDGILKDKVIKVKNENPSDPFYLSDEFRFQLFNFIPLESFINNRILDIKDATGILGFEALSRGASECDFVESDPDNSQLIRYNLGELGLLSRGRVFTLDEADFIKKLVANYNLIFYNSAGEVLDFYLVEKLVQHLNKNGILVVIYSYQIILPYNVKNAKLIQTWQPGELKISIYKNV